LPDPLAPMTPIFLPDRRKIDARRDLSIGGRTGGGLAW